MFGIGDTIFAYILIFRSPCFVRYKGISRFCISILKLVLFGKWIRTIIIYWRVPKFWWLVKLVKLLCFLNRFIFPLLVLLLRVIVSILWFGIVVFDFFVGKNLSIFLFKFRSFWFLRFYLKASRFWILQY